MTASNFLTDPDNAAAFAYLTAVPIGTVRTWAKALGWSGGKMQRFLKAIVRYRLATLEVQHRRTVFRPCVKSDVSHRIVSHRIGNPGTGTGLTASRFGGSPKKIERHEWGELLVATMNEILTARFPDTYLPVRSDNNGSHKAARRFAEAGVCSLEEAISILRGRVLLFNPSKINNDLPHSVGFFTRAVLAEWHRLEREREQLPLLPAIDMQVERVAPAQPVVGSKVLPTASEETIAAGRAEFERIAGDPNPPRRL
jgi:hypothetical protein